MAKPRTRKGPKPEQGANTEDQVLTTTREIEERMAGLPAGARLYLMNRLLDSLRLPPDYEYPTPNPAGVTSEEPSGFFFELKLDNVIHLRAEWDRVGVLDYLTGNQIARDLLEIAERAGQRLDLDWRQSSLVKGENRAKVSYVVGLDDGETFVPITTLPSSLLGNAPEAVRLSYNQKAADAESRFRGTFLAHLHAATRQLLDQTLESLGPTRKKTIRLLEAYTSPLNWSWFPRPVRGGDRRSRYEWTDENCKQFVLKTKSLLELWGYIVGAFRKNDFDPGFLASVTTYEKFSTLIPNGATVPPDLLDRVKVIQRKTGPEYRPLAFAILHARVELGIAKLSYHTLKKYYDKGRRLLKAEGPKSK